MKIAQITTFFHPVTGGVETHVLELSRDLVEKGHDVEVLTSSSNKNGPKITEFKTQFLGVKVRRFRTWFALSPYHRFFPGLFFYLLKQDFDVLHVHGFRKLEVYIAMLIKLIKKGRPKLIVTGHNPFPTTSRRVRFNVLVALHDKTIGQLFTKSIDKIVALVKSEAKKYEKDFNVPKDKIVVIPNGFSEIFLDQHDPDIFFKEWEIDKSKWNAVVASAGRINKAKGFQYLRKAIEKYKKVLFVISGGDDGYLSRLKFELGNYRNVILTEHFLPPVKLAQLFAAADIFVLPSLHEAFGIVLLEAMASELPIISTNAGGPAEFVVEDFGILVQPKDETALSNAIFELVEDKKRREEMGNKAKEFAEKYTWGKITGKIEKLYIN